MSARDASTMRIDANICVRSAAEALNVRFSAISAPLKWHFVVNHTIGARFEPLEVDNMTSKGVVAELNSVK